MTTVTCSWCHAVVTLTGRSVTTCPACGHDAGRPRMDCSCGQCLARLAEYRERVEVDDVAGDLLG